MNGQKQAPDRARREISNIDELLDMARIQQEKRKVAPAIAMSTDIRIYPKELISRLAKKTGGQNAEDGFHYLTIPGDAQTLRKYASNGYEVVFDDDGSVARNETDVVVRCPTQQYTFENQQTVAKSERQMASMLRKDKIDADRSGLAKDRQVAIGKVGAEDIGLSDGA